MYHAPFFIGILGGLLSWEYELAAVPVLIFTVLLSVFFGGNDIVSYSSLRGASFKQYRSYDYFLGTLIFYFIGYGIVLGIKYLIKL